MTDYYSQQNEDKVLENIMSQIKVDRGWFVDIGAWDGKYLSNTYLFAERGWKGIEVEADKRKFVDLIKNFFKNPNIYPVLYTVLPDNIDTLLSLYPVPKRFNILSIDIDSYDYWIWKNLKNYFPDVVVIESNGIDNEYYQPATYGYKGKKGAGKQALRNLAKEKGYYEVYDNGNMFFVRKDLSVTVSL